MHNLRKKAYNCGETFTHQFTYGKKKGKKITIKERRMGPPCHCKKQCTSILNQASRQEIVSSFKKLSNITEKRLFILKCVKRNSKARSNKRQIENEGRLRKTEYSYKYYFPKSHDPTQSIEVCQVMFLKTLSISKQIIKTAFKKIQVGGVEKEMRGTHVNHYKISISQEQPIINHIRQFKVVESHYVRQKYANVQFLPHDLTKKEMHRLYTEDCKANGIHPQSYDFCRHVMNKMFRLIQFIPKKDQCNVCLTYKNTRTKTPNMEAEYKRHHQDKLYTRTLKGMSKTRC